MSVYDLVVAHYREDVSWLRRVHKDFQVYLFSKGEQVSDHAIRLPNVGREAHTYLTFIVDHYDTLREWTVFSQGFPFDHEPAFHRRLNQLRTGDLGEHKFIWMGNFVDYDTGDGNRLFTKWSKNVDGHGLNVHKLWSDLFETQPPEKYYFFPGGQFMVHRDQILKRSIGFYQRALELSGTFTDAAHCYERCWNHVFLAPEFNDAVKAQPMPIHLRPNKTMGITWDTVGRIPRHPFYG